MTHRWKSIASLPVLALSLVMLANCNGRDDGDDAANSAMGAAGNGMENMAAAADNTLQNAGQAMMATPSPQEFVDRAAKSDAFEIAAARLAASNSASAEVKEFARMMIEAHTQSSTRLKAAAGSARPAITPNAAPTEQQSSNLAKLRGLNGAAFDEEYIDGQVDAHEDALALMRKYAADGAEGSLKTAARDMVPIIEQHLNQARQLDRNGG